MSMRSTKKNEHKDEGGQGGFGCCPEIFREMFGQMATCCPGPDDFPDFREVISRMRAGCCGPERESEKEQ